MKKRKILYLFPLVALILSGCDFSPQDILKNAGDFFTDKVFAPVKDFFVPSEEGPKEEKPSEDEQGGEEQGGEEQGGEETPTKTLQAINVSGEFKEEYEVGESFDPTGIIITAVYDDQSTEDVTALTSFSGFNSENPGEITVTASYEGQEATIELTILAPINSISFSDVVELFAENGVEGVVLPNYVTDGYRDFDDEYGVYLIFDSSHEEMDAYAEALEEAGWNLEKDEYDDYEGTFADTLAGIYLGDYIDYDFGAILLEFYINKAPSSEIPFDEIEALFAEYDYEYYGHVPNFETENGTFLVSEYSSTGWFVDGALIEITGATEEEFNTYLETTLPAAGWEVGGGIATQAFPDLGGLATLAYGQLTADSYGIVLWFGFSPIPTSEFPSAALAEAFETLGVTPFEIPAPDGEGFTYEYAFDDLNLNYVTQPDSCYDYLYINNMDEDAFAAYIEKIVAAGWSDSNNNGSHTFTKQIGEKLAKFTAKHYYSEAYGHYVALTIYYVLANAPAWPTDKAAQLVQKFAPGSTTVVPPCPNGTKYTAYIGSSYNEIDVQGDSALLDQYAAILRTAGWTETGDGTYVFISPNEDIQLTLEFTSYGLEIRFASYSPTGPVLNYYNVQKINGDLASYGYEFVLPEFGLEGVTWYYFDPDEESPAYEIATIVSSSTVADKAVADFEAAMVEAGYTVSRRNSYGEPIFSSPTGAHELSVSWGYSGGYIFFIDIYPVDAPQPGEGLSPEEIANELGGWIGAYPTDNEDGSYSLLQIYDDSDPENECSPAEVAEYLEMIIEEGYAETDLEAVIEFYEFEGVYSALYMNDANTAAEFYIYNETLYVDGDGYLCDEDDEGATPFKACIVEIDVYTAE